MDGTTGHAFLQLKRSFQMFAALPVNENRHLTSEDQPLLQEENCRKAACLTQVTLPLGRVCRQCPGAPSGQSVLHRRSPDVDCVEHSWTTHLETENLQHCRSHSRPLCVRPRRSGRTETRGPQESPLQRQLEEMQRKPLLIERRPTVGAQSQTCVPKGSCFASLFGQQMVGHAQPSIEPYSVQQKSRRADGNTKPKIASDEEQP